MFLYYQHFCLVIYLYAYNIKKTEFTHNYYVYSLIGCNVVIVSRLIAISKNIIDFSVKYHSHKNLPRKMKVNNTCIPQDELTTVVF